MPFATVNGAQSTDVKVTTFKGLAHLKGQIVHAVNIKGTLSLGSVTVDDDGAIELAEPADNLIVGRDFQRKIILLPPDIAGQDGPQVGKKMRLSRIYLEVYNTVDVKVGNARLWVRNVTDDLSVDPSPVSKIISFRLGGYSREPEFEIMQEDPLNFTLLAATLEVKL